MNSKVRVEIPIRIGMLLANARKCVEPGDISGGAGFALHNNNYIEISFSDRTIINSKNKMVLWIYCVYFKTLFNYAGGFKINTKREVTPQNGYGSTITEITALCIGINKLFDNQLNKSDIRKIIKELYCEFRNNKIKEGYDSGLGALACLEGGLVYTQNLNTYIRCEWNPDYKVLAFNNGLINCNTMEEVELVEQVLRPNELKDYVKKQDIINKHLIPNILNANYENIGRDMLAIHYIGSKRAECAQYGFERQMGIICGALENGASIAGLSSFGPLNYVVVPEDKKIALIQYLENYHKIQTIKEYEICLKGIEGYRDEENI